MTIDNNDPILLRVRRNSQLDNVLRPMLTGEYEGLDERDVRDIGGLAKMPRLLRTMDRWFDNLSITQTGDVMKAGYTDVLPKRPQPISVKIEANHNSSLDDMNLALLQDLRPELYEEAVQRFPVIVTGTTSEPEFLDEDETHVMWPDVPPQIVSEPWFVKPSWFDDMEFAISTGYHVSLASPPGVGKDVSVQELSIRHGKPLVTVSGDAGFRRRDLVGTQEIRNGRTVFEVADYAAAVVNGWWVLITEINAADADAILFMNNQLAAPYTINIKGRQYPVHPDFRLFVSYNPGLVGTKPLPQSFKDRFFPIKQGFLSNREMRERLVAHGMPTGEGEEPLIINEKLYEGRAGYWITKLLDYYRAMVDANEAGQIRYQITSRRMIMTVKVMAMCQECGPDELRSAIRKAVVAAIDEPMDAKTAERLLRETVN